MGDSAAAPGPGAGLKGGTDRGGVEPESRGGQRHGLCEKDAEGKAETLCEFQSETERMKQLPAVEMTGYGKRGKPQTGFPSFPTALGNRCAIPTFPQPRRRPRGKLEIQNQDSHFPTAACRSFTNLKKEDSPERRSAVLQAHSSIRKCCYLPTVRCSSLPAPQSYFRSEAAPCPRFRGSSDRCGKGRGGTTPVASRLHLSQPPSLRATYCVPTPF